MSPSRDLFADLYGHLFLLIFNMLSGVVILRSLLELH